MLVHGAGVSSEVWDQQVEAFRREHNLLLPDLRGHGGSAGLEGRPDRPPYTWESVSRDVLDLMDHHGIDAAHMVGVSMGCIVIRTLAGIAPERVRSMVLAGGIARLNTLARVLIVLAHAFKHVLPHMWLYRINAWIVLPLWGHRETRQLVVHQARRMPRHEFLRWLQVTHGLPERLRRFEQDERYIPTLFVMGDQDHMFLPGAREVVARQPRARLHVIENCGHVCTVQRAVEFNRVSLSFLRETAV